MSPPTVKQPKGLLHPHDVQQNGIHESRPPSSIAPLPCLVAHLSTAATFIMDMVQHGHLDRLVFTQDHMQQPVMRCVFWHLYLNQQELLQQSELQ